MTQLNEILQKYQEYTNTVKQTASSKLPLLSTLNNFQLFILLNLLLIVLLYFINLLRDTDILAIISPFNFWKRVFRWLRLYVPAVRNRVDKELALVAPTINNSIPT